MDRRKFVIGLGSLAAGGAAATGTGAFTSSSVDRQFTASVANDANGYVGLQQITGSANSNQHVSGAGSGELALEIGNSGNGGGGVNLNSHTRLDDLFKIVNQGTQTVYVSISITGNGTNTNAYFYDSDNPQNGLSGDTGNPGAYTDQGDSDNVGPDPSNIQRGLAELTPGGSVSVGFDIEAVGSSQTAFAADGGLQINADADASNLPGTTYTP